MLNPGNNFRFSTFFNVAAIGPNHDIDIKVDKTGNVKAVNKKNRFFYKKVTYFNLTGSS